MAHYLDPQHYLDTDYLVAAVPCTGNREEGALYIIHCVLHVGESAVPLPLPFPTRADRDDALTILLTLIKADMDGDPLPADWEEESYGPA